jgi:uncharacterized protein (TIGR03435 family)
MTVGGLVRAAFNLKPWEIAPDRDAVTGIIMGPISLSGYDVVARVPAGATKEQCLIMFQNLLIERLKLAYHYEKRDGDVYDLVVAKNGPKFRESPFNSTPAENGAEPASSSARVTGGGINGCSGYVENRGHVEMIGLGSNACIDASEARMADFVSLIQNHFVLHPVVDSTGLAGRYDFKLAFDGPSTLGMDAGERPDALPSLFSAVQDQLGLRLEKKKGQIDFFVIDHVEKTPLPN